VGPAGPVGPDAEDAIYGLAGDLEEGSSKVDQVESDLDDLSSMTGFLELQSKVQELDTAVSEMCSGLGSTYYTVGTELEDLISSMYSGCP